MKIFRCVSLSTAVLATALSACKIESDPADAPEVEDFVPPADEGPFVPPPPAPGTRRIVVLHTNDEHSHLLGFGPTSEYAFLPEEDGTFDDVTTTAAIAGKIVAGNDDTIGGAARRQFRINQIRQASTDPVLLLSAGDVMMGTLFHNVITEPSAHASPDYLTMALMGYDFVSLGNHEFDFGPDMLAQAIRHVHQTTFGAAVPILAGNIHFDDVGAGGAGSELQALYSAEGDSGAPIMPWATKVLENGLKVGFFGLVGYDAALVAPAKDPIAFSVPQTGSACTDDGDCTGAEAGFSCTLGHCVDVRDAEGHVFQMAQEAQALIDTLRDDEGCDVVIGITHAGMIEDTALAGLTDRLDVIIGGHSHEEIPPTVVSGTIIVQAGRYGEKLGELTLEVTPNSDTSAGAPEYLVTHVAAESTLHPIDASLDAQILAGSDLLNGVVSPAFETALTYTGAVIAPLVAGLNAAFAPVLGTFGVTSIIEPLPFGSTYDIIGEIPYEDSNLAHMVTDAERATFMGGFCPDPAASAIPTIAVQANGVLRESLHFGEPGGTATTFDDLYRVMPLGASPFETGAFQAPGFPMVFFHLTDLELRAGVDVGAASITVDPANPGLGDSFFLSYAGMRVTYDLTRVPYSDQASMADPARGRVVKIEIGTDQDSYAWTLYDVSRDPTGGNRWRNSDNTTPYDPTTAPKLFGIVSNLYLAGFLDAFGLVPRQANGAPVAGATTGERLRNIILCQDPTETRNCAASRAEVFYCAPAWGQATQWQIPEMKEWQAVMGYLAALAGGNGGTLPTFYQGATPASPRVIDGTP